MAPHDVVNQGWREVYIAKRDSQTNRIRRRRQKRNNSSADNSGRTVADGAPQASCRSGDRVEAERSIFRHGYPTEFGSIKGFRSGDHPILQKLVAALPRAIKHKVHEGQARPQRLLSGSDKAHVGTGDSKMLALYSSYVCLNGHMRSFIRVDVDRTFSSLPTLTMAIANCGLPPPNLIVCLPRAGSRIVRPHLLYALQQAVCFTANGSARAKRLFLAVEECLTLQMLPLGADRGGLSNRLRIKNPLSPCWHTIVGADQPYQLTSGGKGAQPELVALSDFLPLERAREIREQVYQEDSTKPESAKENKSNFAFDILRQQAHRIVGRHKVDGRRKSFHLDLLSFAVKHQLFNSELDEAAHDLCSRVSDYVWEHHDPSRAYRVRPHRGICANECYGKPLAEQQAIGGRSTAARRRAESVTKQVAVIHEMWQRRELAPGVFPDDALLASRSELHVRTIARCRDAVRAAVHQDDRRYIDKKLNCGPRSPGFNNPPPNPDICLQIQHQNLRSYLPSSDVEADKTVQAHLASKPGRDARATSQCAGSAFVSGPCTDAHERGLWDSGEANRLDRSRRDTGGLGDHQSRTTRRRGHAQSVGEGPDVAATAGIPLSTGGFAKPERGSRQRVVPRPARRKKGDLRSAFPPGTPQEIVVAPVLDDLNVEIAFQCLRIEKGEGETIGASLRRVQSMAATLIKAMPHLSCRIVNSDDLRHAWGLPKDNAYSKDNLRTVDLVILELPTEGKTSSSNGRRIDYAKEALDLLWTRQMNGRITWVWTQEDPYNERFQDFYGQELAGDISAYRYGKDTEVVALWKSSQAYKNQVEYTRRLADIAESDLRDYREKHRYVADHRFYNASERTYAGRRAASSSRQHFGRGDEDGEEYEDSDEELD